MQLAKLSYKQRTGTPQLRDARLQGKSIPRGASFQGLAAALMVEGTHLEIVDLRCDVVGSVGRLRVAYRLDLRKE